MVLVCLITKSGSRQKPYEALAGRPGLFFTFPGKTAKLHCLWCRALLVSRAWSVRQHIGSDTYVKSGHFHDGRHRSPALSTSAAVLHGQRFSLLSARNLPAGVLHGPAFARCVLALACELHPSTCGRGKVKLNGFLVVLPLPGTKQALPLCEAEHCGMVCWLPLVFSWLAGVLHYELHLCGCHAGAQRR